MSFDKRDVETLLEDLQGQSDDVDEAQALSEDGFNIEQDTRAMRKQIVAAQSNGARYANKVFGDLKNKSINTNIFLEEVRAAVDVYEGTKGQYYRNMIDYMKRIMDGPLSASLNLFSVASFLCGFAYWDAAATKMKNLLKAFEK